MKTSQGGRLNMTDEVICLRPFLLSARPVSNTLRASRFGPHLVWCHRVCVHSFDAEVLCIKWFLVLLFVEVCKHHIR